MHHEPAPPPPLCPACGGQGERAPRRPDIRAPFICFGRCGVTLYHGTDIEWMDPRYVASRERFNREGGR